MGLSASIRCSSAASASGTGPSCTITASAGRNVWRSTELSNASRRNPASSPAYTGSSSEKSA